MPKDTNGRPDSEIELEYMEAARAHALRLLPNRNPRPFRAKRGVYFADCLKNDTYVQGSPQPICLDHDGHPRDGQHRLWAIDTTGIGAWVYVAYNCSDEQVASLDAPSIRPLEVRVRALGVPLTKQHITLMNAMRGGMSSTLRTMAPAEALAFYRQHHEAIEAGYRVYNLVKTGNAGIRTGPVAGALARAFYHVGPEVVSRFIWGLGDWSKSGAGDRTVAMLRAFLTGKERRHDSGGRVETYAKTERAILAFAKGETLSSLGAMREELFPLPDLHDAEARGTSNPHTFHLSRGRRVRQTCQPW